MVRPIAFTLNGRPVSADADGSPSLLQALRGELGATGAKYGCGIAQCGACEVLVDGHATRACITPLERVAGRAVTTVEGFASGGALDALQQAFVEHGALQCGFCTPGMLVAAHALLRAHPKPTREQIVAALDGQLCRCGAHQRIIAAVEAASRAAPGRA